MATHQSLLIIEIILLRPVSERLKIFNVIVANIVSILKCKSNHFEIPTLFGTKK